ncbi:hypothetical protein BX616_008932, partial [Lobosporangium transversale]
MTSTNIISASLTSTGKKRARDEVESTSDVNVLSSRAPSDPDEHRGKLVPFMAVSKDMHSAYSRLFLDFQNYSSRGRPDPLPAVYQDGDEVFPRKWLTLEDHVMRTHKDGLKRGVFALFHLHEPSLFKQLEKRKPRLVSKQDWKTAEKAKTAPQQQPCLPLFVVVLASE